MDIEDLDLPNSWISIRALRNAANIRCSLESNMPYKSISSSTDLQFSLHNTISKTPQNKSENIDLELLKGPFPSESPCKARVSNKKNPKKIQKLNEEIGILSFQLKQANEIIGKLSRVINEINSKHALHIQAMQERHEQKAKRHAQDIKCMIQEFNSKNLSFFNEVLINEHKAEIGGIRQRCEQEVIEQRDLFHGIIEKEAEKHRGQMKNVKTHCLKLVSDLKHRFLVEIEQVENSFKEKIKKLTRESYLKQRYSNVFHDDDSTAVEADNESESDEFGSIEHQHNQNLASRMSFIFNSYQEELNSSLIFQDLCFG